MQDLTILFFFSVNALTLLISLILLGNSDVKSDWQRAEQIFELFDFNQTGRLNIDEIVSYIISP